jgi:hypothetical protein
MPDTTLPIIISPTTSRTMLDNTNPVTSTTAIPSYTPTSINPGLAKTKALEYVSKTYSISMDKLQVYNQEPETISQITKEIVQYLVIGDGHDFYRKLYVDMNYEVWEASQYKGIAGKSDQEIAGNLNLGLYLYLQDKVPGTMVKVMIVVSLISDLSTSLPAYIESKGFKITRMGDTSGSRFIYTQLSKEMIIELANRDGIYIQQDLPTGIP